MNKSGSRYILLLVFLIFGIVVSVQLKSTFTARKQTASAALDVQTLKEQLAVVQKETAELKAKIDENLVIRNEIIKEYIQQQDDSTLANEWEKIKLSTGLVDVKGPGITIKLDDAMVNEPEYEVRWQIIHDDDIKTILNDLKKAGAQAITINGERVVPMSEQLCAGPTIKINDNRYPVPYVIEAIGNPDMLYEAISTSSRIAEMTEFKIRVEITKSKELTLSKFSGADKLERYISGLEVVKQ
ncbi:MAG: DUF881 domain-containing protein [Clostridiaceae bacterium]